MKIKKKNKNINQFLYLDLRYKDLQIENMLASYQRYEYWLDGKKVS